MGSERAIRANSMAKVVFQVALLVFLSDVACLGSTQEQRPMQDRDILAYNCAQALREISGDLAVDYERLLRLQVGQLAIYFEQAELFRKAGRHLSAPQESSPVTAPILTEADYSSFANMDPLSISEFRKALRYEGGDLHLSNDGRNYFRVVGESPHAVLDPRAEGWILVHEVVGHFSNWVKYRDVFSRLNRFKDRPGYHAARYLQTPIGIRLTETYAILQELQHYCDEVDRKAAALGSHPEVLGLPNIVELGRGDFRGPLNEQQVTERVRYPFLQQAKAFGKVMRDLKEIATKSWWHRKTARRLLAYYDAELSKSILEYIEKLDDALLRIVVHHMITVDINREGGFHEFAATVKSHIDSLRNVMEVKYPAYCTKPKDGETDPLSQEMRAVHLRYRMLYEQYRESNPLRPSLTFVHEGP